MDQAILKPEGFHLVVPFYFAIPRTIVSSNSGSILHSLRLPPSIELGGVIIDELSGNRFAQPSISYQVRAIVKFSGQGEDPMPPTEISTPIIIVPNTEELPPTETKDFPREFLLRESKTIRSSLLGCSHGTMAVSMQEPHALIYTCSSTKASTEGFLNLEVESTSPGNIHQSLQATSITVLSLIRVKTFYSIEAFPRLPSQTLLGVHPGTRLRDDIIKLETQHIPRLFWGYKYDMAEHTMIGEATQCGEDSADSSSTKTCRKSWGSGIQAHGHTPPGKWVAKISHPISVDARLLPTFCSSTVARLYSIILRVRSPASSCAHVSR